MAKNRHKGMELKYVWFKPREHNKLINAIECNNKDEAFKILMGVHLRGDL